MREGKHDFAAVVLAHLQRRLRLLAIFVMLGGTGLIVAHDASAVSIATVGLLVLGFVSFWLIASFWVWVFRNRDARHGS